MTVLGTIELLGIRVNLVACAMDDTILGRNASHLIVVVCEVTANTIGKVLTDIVIPCKTKFHTGVLHVTTVDYRTLCSGSCQYWSLNEPVLGLFDIPVGSQ